MIIRPVVPALAALLSFASACATAPPPPPQSSCASCAHGAHDGHPHHGGGGPGRMHAGMTPGAAPTMPAMAALPPTLADFRAVLHPLWHAEAGAQRVANTCEQAATLGQRADAVFAAPVPEAARGDEVGWRDAASALQRSTAALPTLCGAAARPGVADGLANVHTAFHGLLDRVGVRMPPGR